MQISIDQLNQIYSINEIRKLLALYIVYLPDNMEAYEYDIVHKKLSDLLPAGNVIVIQSTTKEIKLELLSINQLTDIDTDTIKSLLNTIKEYGIKPDDKDTFNTKHLLKAKVNKEYSNINPNHEYHEDHIHLWKDPKNAINEHQSNVNDVFESYVNSHEDN